MYYEGCQSASLPVISGVPQGSVLGPLLFLIYVNDAPSSVSNASLYLFADDAKLLKILRACDSADCLQQDLESLSVWSSQWNLLFNVAKCFHLRFQLTENAATTTFCHQDTTIQEVSSVKDLGKWHSDLV